jgi:hypothetical protein
VAAKIWNIKAAYLFLLALVDVGVIVFRRHSVRTPERLPAVLTGFMVSLSLPGECLDGTFI